MGFDDQACSSMTIRLLLAANEELESVYRLKSEACVALALSRNYSLLAQTKTILPDRFSWKNKTKYWWQEYLKHCTGKNVDLLFLHAESGAMLELVK